MKCSVLCIPTRSPSDITGLEKYVEEGTLLPQDVVAVMGKTEGNGCVNDFTRGYAVRCVSDYFRNHIGDAADGISYVMSGGTEGILSPHLTVISRSPGTLGNQPNGNVKSLVIGSAKTRSFAPEEIGRAAQLDEVATTVNKAIREAGIENLSDVHFVQIKCPLLTADQIHSAGDRGASVVTDDTYKSMGYSRGASALGVAVALGEVDRSALQDQDICGDWSKYSKVASTSSGSELSYCEVIVFGNAAGAEGPYYIDHEVMKDAIDGAALKRIVDRQPEGEELVQVLAKAEADPTGFTRGRRHTMLDDSDVNHTRQARAVVGGVLASVCGNPMIYVSGGAEHQGPAGGGPVAAIFRRVP